MSRIIIPGLIIGSLVHIAKFGAAIGHWRPGQDRVCRLAARPSNRRGPRSLALHGQDPHQQPSD